MENYIVLGIIVVMVIGVIVYLHKAKKRGKNCIGCPYCDQCSGHCQTKETEK